MKRDVLTIITLIGISAMVFFLANCGDEGTDPEPNKPPTVSITSPSNNAAIEKGETVQITVTANDPDGSVSNVTIFLDNVEEDSFNSPPYSLSVPTAEADVGPHTVKAVATDNEGLTATAQITVNITESDPPTVTTADITDITAVSAAGGGEVTDDGGNDITGRGIVWAKSSGPTVENNAGKTEDGTGAGAFTSSLTELDQSTEYFVRAYAINSVGTAYGEEKSFITKALASIVTGTVTDVTSSSAICSAEITNDGGDAVTARGLVWSTTNNQVTLDDADGVTIEGTGSGTFSSPMTALTRYTDYWVRPYATNGAGTAYGDAIQFKTFAEQPTITTTDVTDIEAHLARAGGELTDDGGDPYTGFGLVWASFPNPEYFNNEGLTSEPSYVSPFDTLLTGLESATTHYVRAWALNSEGTVVYGEEKSFTTASFLVTAGSFTDSRDNTMYNTITISGQTWMAENLAYLPEVCESNTECGYWVYDYQGTDVPTAMGTANYTTYGVLYDYDAALTACPTGWHLPSDYEWSVLEVNLGMSISQTIITGSRGTNQGGKMKETGTTHWTAPNEGATNISGFTGLPGGFRNWVGANKDFQTLGSNGFFWTSTKEGNWVNYRQLYSVIAQVGSEWISYFDENSVTPGGSVRCVQD
jgi:uncharacterized protein (TIGR02145 family)